MVDSGPSVGIGQGVRDVPVRDIRARGKPELPGDDGNRARDDTAAAMVGMDHPTLIDAHVAAVGSPIPVFDAGCVAEPFTSYGAAVRTA